MPNAPVYDIDPKLFWHDPYPDLKKMRENAPVTYVPQLGATLITRRNDIFTVEKKIDVFSSNQPNGLMTQLMGQNMMRKDGAPHMAERKAIFPTVSPKTVQDIWKAKFESFTKETLAEIEPKGYADVVADIAMRLSGEALVVITGLRNMTWQEMDRVSQGMIDGCSNYAGDPQVEARCNDCTASIDRHIDQMFDELYAHPDTSMLSVQMQAGLSIEQIRANIKLAISGGQNEPHDVIAGLVWALLEHPEQLKLVQNGTMTWLQAFEEYVRWMSPIGMSPREIVKPYEIHGVTLEPGERVFLMFGSGNRDAEVFARPDTFDITQDCAASIAFGAGPHFCAGAWASRCLIAEVTVPAIFETLKDLRLDGETTFGGWAFRGPLYAPVAWGA
ncbi:cytochrome P450 [Sulfitobacter sp. SK012]|uniref:cytochrome P450 n=1 Tax=Sulfitobacter sp. SK012 TaxID=1389005 RepID=UPI000E0A27F2|nr:cytochrome P450 [Sulfitobacter sp. SK012]AXI47159.1 cytochrome P450 [Sulfitobacter sp. SK012]